jgi:hypothetical protein
MKKISTIPVFILLLLFTGCKKPGCLGNPGRVITSTRPLSPFTELLLEDNINLVLVQGNEEKMEIEAPENMVPNIISTISGGKLTLQNETDCRWARNPDEKINVRLYFKTLGKIDYEGSGDITNTDTLRLDALQIETTFGAGSINLTVDNGYTGAYIFRESADITLHGKTDVCFTYTNARGQTDMADFVVKKMVIEYGGLGDTHVNVTDELNAIIFFKGNIYYKGSPVITRSTYYSTGTLIRTP